MPKPARIYTRTGDDGTTGLVGGQRVHKSSGRIECFGAVDECSTVIGLARRALKDEPARVERVRVLDTWLAWVQDLLFNLGSDLATLPADRRADAPTVSAADIASLERAIDGAQDELEPLTNFILPGGSWPGAFLHQARTVCRRAERLMAGLAKSENVSSDALIFINRLSDALFVWARWINAGLGETEHRWNQKSTPPS
ncbi:MAG TPA: cob(I)yrinic acid a,c-diamide adenosyltransferase [Candidatus Eremiobacteraceae bacterium]|nr:cob(I)yrinic acid a,c-diamide adenosyltransferase [Candidatus Eremiobacteraceae bacterium]